MPVENPSYNGVETRYSWTSAGLFWGQSGNLRTTSAGLCHLGACRGIRFLKSYVFCVSFGGERQIFRSDRRNDQSEGFRHISRPPTPQPLQDERRRRNNNENKLNSFQKWSKQWWHHIFLKTKEKNIKREFHNQRSERNSLYVLFLNCVVQSILWDIWTLL